MNILSFVSLSETKGNPARSSAVHDNQLYLGLGDGSVSIYDISSLNESKDKSPMLTLRQQLKLCEQSIDQLQILPDMGYLIILSGGLVYIYTLPDFQLEEKLSQFKNTNLIKIFSNINENMYGTYSQIMDNSYAEKNSLVDYSDSMSLATANSTNLFDSNHVVQDREVVQDYRSYIAICCKRKLVVYTFIKDEFSSKIEYNLTDKVKNLEFLSSEKLVLGLNKNDLDIIDLYDPDPQSSVSKLSTLPYLSSSVVNSSSTFSYFRSNTSHSTILRTLPHINIISKESIALKVNNNGEYLQYTKKSSKKNPLHFSKTPDLLVYWFPYLILAYNATHTVEIRKVRTGNVIQTVHVDSAIRSIEHHEDFLMLMTDNGVETWKRASFIDQLNQAKDLSKFEDAISLIEKLQPALFESEIEDAEMTNKDKKFLILRDFQIKYAKELYEKGEHSRAVDLFISFMAPPDLVIELFPPVVSGHELVDLSAHGDADSSDELSVLSPTRDNRKGRSSPRKRHKEKSHIKPLLMKLIPYLTDTRRKLNKLMNPESPKFDWRGVTIGKDIYLLTKTGQDETLHKSMELVDTTLFRSYLLSSPRLVGPLLRVHNYCNVEVVEQNLKFNLMFKELIDFYYGKEMHSTALDLLHELGSTNDTFHGPLPTIQYLQKLNDDHLSLIFKYLEWPISLDTAYCEEVFLNDSIESESLNKFKVLTFLENQVHEEKIIVKYLEHLIYELSDETTKFHNRLAEIYIKNKEVKKLNKLVGDSDAYDFNKIVRSIDESHDREFLVAKTVILSKLKEHEQVLKIFVYELQKYELALSYCLKIYNEDPDKGEELLTSLLMKYFHSEKTTGEALELLATQGLKLNFGHVLDNIPSSLSVAKLQKFLTTNLQRFEAKVNTTNFEKSLIELRKVKLKERHLSLQSEHVIIDEDSVCKVCKKRLGHSVLSWLPDNVVVHYGCTAKLQ